MGRSSTPTYRVEIGPIRLPDGRTLQATPMAWETNHAGRPTAANLARWIAGHVASMRPGGVNAHIARAYGVLPVPTRAKIVRQRTGEVVADWRAPAFMIF